ncbi:MAG: AmmeMemoRadiSam system protein A [Deltaproteobacteria bacterium]|jgi:AmmeMemoRadiSam system protein A|nr:AmmeMemoRadiSam system protein A [Deltaproteobacteria bacterium]
MPYSHQLTDAEKREILRIARTAIAEWTLSQRLPPGKPHKKTLLEPAGAFVSLHRGNALRGCIGIVEAQKPLYLAVQEMAVAAATRDPRFGPVTSRELDELDIEVSVLGGLEPLGSPADVAIGVHGLSIDQGGARGLLLPQVASKRGWSAEEFLAALCEKARLPDDAWQRDDAVIQRFTAQVFDDDEYPPIDPMALLGEDD